LIDPDELIAYGNRKDKSLTPQCIAGQGSFKAKFVTGIEDSSYLLCKLSSGVVGIIHV